MTIPHTDFPDDENGHVLRYMSEQGIDLTVPRDIEFAHLAPDEAAARAFAKEAEAAGFGVEIVEPDEESIDEGQTEWDVICTRRMTPTHGEITEVENALAARAATYGCEADGWGFLH